MKIGRRLFLIPCILIPLAAVSLSAFQVPEQPEALFTQGNAAYQKGDYASAERCYRRILESGAGNESLYFNLGNACFKQKKLGEAIYYWEKARRISPADREARENLDLANLLVVDQIETPEDPFPVRILKGFRDLLTTVQEGWLILILFLGANALFFLFIMLKDPRRSFRALVGSLATGFLLLIFAGSFAWKIYDRDFVRKGIVLEQKADVLSGPGSGNITVFTIHEGTKVRVHQTSNGWHQVSLPNGWNGWLRADAVGML